MLPGATPNPSTALNQDPQPQHHGECCVCTPAHLTHIAYLTDLNHRVGAASQTLLAQNDNLRAFNHSLKEVLASVIDSDAAHRAKIDTLERRVREQSEFIRNLMRQLEDGGTRHEADMASGDEPPKD